MPVYPTSFSDRMEPLEEPEPTAFEVMDMCTHNGACERLYQMFIDSRDHLGWREDMARILKCSECEEWSDA